MTMTDTHRFPSGHVVATRSVANWMADDDEGVRIARTAFVAGCLHRHLTGDWGVLDDEDRAANERAITLGNRILSAYNAPPHAGDRKIWVITEADRSSTTILFPEDY